MASTWSTCLNDQLFPPTADLPHSEVMRAFRILLARVDLGRVWMHHWEGVQRIISDV